MKCFLVPLGVLAGLATPWAAQADPPDKVIVSADRPPSWLVHTETVGQGDRQATYYYTNIVLTGSRTPVVLRRYKGRIIIVGAVNPGRAFSNSAIAMDPAVSKH